jgi:hypothetical protein
VLTGFACSGASSCSSFCWVQVQVFGTASATTSRTPPPTASSIWGGQTSKSWKGLAANREVQLDTRGCGGVARGDSGMQAHQRQLPRVARQQLSCSRGMNYGSFTINGLPRSISTLQNQVILSGRFINEMDQQRTRKVIVIAEDCREGAVQGRRPDRTMDPRERGPVPGRGCVPVRDRWPRP